MKVVEKNSISIVKPGLTEEPLKRGIMEIASFVEKNFSTRSSSRVYFAIDTGSVILFPTGLLPKLYSFFDSCKVKYKVIDEKKAPVFGSPIQFKGETRDYQAIEEEIFQKRAGMLSMATSSGKTAVISRFIGYSNLKTLIIVPTKDLLYQTSKDISQFLGIEVGIIGDGIDDRKKVTVATIQSLYRNFNKKYASWSDTIDLLIVDECHRMGSESYYKVLSSIPAYYRFGFSGTAFRNDSAGIVLKAVTGEILKKVTASELIEKEYLSELTINMVDYKANNIEARTYQEIYEEGIVYNNRRNYLIKKIAEDRNKKGHSVLILVKLIEHGKILQDIIADSVFISGSNKTQVRNEVKEKLKTKDQLCVIATTIFDEGVNVPSLDSVIMASGGKSKVKTIQRAGRALRRTEKKTKAEIIDFIDRCHGILMNHSEQRLSSYRKERGYKIKIRKL